MSRYLHPDVPITDSKGRALSFGRVYFGQPNQAPKENTKQPFSDSEYQNALNAAQVLNSGGKFNSDIYLNGAYSILVEDSNGNQIKLYDSYEIRSSFGSSDITHTSNGQESDLNTYLANRYDVSVKDAPYNALGDGVNDDSGALTGAFINPVVPLKQGIYSIASNVSSMTVQSLEGSGWQRNANGDLAGTVIKAASTAVTDPLTFSSTSPSSDSATDLQGLSLSDFGVIHRGTGAGITIDNIVRSNIDYLYVDCQNEGAIGVKLDNWAFFSVFDQVYVQRFTDTGVLVDGDGTQATFNDCHIASGNGNYGIETRRAGTIVRGGQINVSNTDGIGVYFHNTAGSNIEGGLVDGTLSEAEIAIKIDGDTNAFLNVEVRSPRILLGSGQKGVVFGRATNGILQRPIAVSPTGGTIVEFEDNAIRCGMIGDYNACRSGIIVDPSATDCFVICEEVLSYANRSNLTTDPNLTVVCHEVEHVGRTRHNGVNWDKHFQFMNDETAISITPPDTGGRIKIINRDTHIAHAEYAFEANAGVVGVLDVIHQGSLAANATGELTGTTGADGAFTVSADSVSGDIYLENRLGSGQNIIVIFDFFD